MGECEWDSSDRIAQQVAQIIWVSVQEISNVYKNYLHWSFRTRGFTLGALDDFVRPTHMYFRTLGNLRYAMTLFLGSALLT